MFSEIYNFFVNITIIAVVICSVIMFLLYFFQNKLLYMPVVQGLPQSSKFNPQGYRNPNEQNLVYQDVHITTSDKLRLHGWISLQKDPKQSATVLYLHENAGNIGTRIPYMKKYYEEGYNVMLIAYRGYSESEGSPSERGLQLDVQAIFQHLFNRQDIDTKKIFIHGRSLGGAVAIYACSELEKYRPAGLIAEITFTSIPEMVDVVFPQLAYPFLKKLLIRNHWRSIDRIGNIEIPIHFIFAMKDELVPPAHMQRLYEKAQKCLFKSYYQVQNGTHNMNWQYNPESYFTSINEFVNKALKDQKIL